MTKTERILKKFQRVMKPRQRKTYLLDPKVVDGLHEKCDSKGIKYSYAVEYGLEHAIKELNKLDDIKDK